jgi:8-oxo-dGTP pyrophosphatase MutT (NUDIX family)
MNDDETSYLVTATRETKEECNIDININKRIETVGLVPYIKKKNLYLFLVEMDEIPEVKCNTFYEIDGKLEPEMVDYKWIEIDEYSKYVSKGLINVFDLIKERVINFIEMKK